MTGRPFTVLVAVDSSDFAGLVLEHALDLALARDNAEVHVLGVLEVERQPRAQDRRHDGDLEEIEKRLRAQVEEALDDIASPGDGRISIRVHARLGRPHEQILEVAAECRADLILLGRHGAGKPHRGRRAGSVPALVLEGARCSLSVVSPIDYGEAAEVEDACDQCVTARRESSGERWFCETHATGYTWRTSRMPSGPLERDQGIWF